MLVNGNILTNQKSTFFSSKDYANLTGLKQSKVYSHFAVNYLEWYAMI